MRFQHGAPASLRRSRAIGAVVLSALVTSASCVQILGFDQRYQETGGSSGTGGTGAVAPPLPCTTVADCPGQGTVCGPGTCTAGFCSDYTAAGTAIPAQPVGNCQKIVCNGSGNIVLEVDDSNVPDDNNPCNQDLCTDGVPSNPPVKSGTPCGASLTCDGQGHCAGCTSPADCPGQDTSCETRSCTASLCGFIYATAGTSAMMPTPGSCTQNVCNGMGAVSVVLDSTNVPTSTNPCVIEGCSMGAPTATNVVAGVACTGATGDTVCDGNGNCAQCVAPANCPGTDTACQTRTCTANICGVSYVPKGTMVPPLPPGNCQQNQCNGMGAVVAVADDTNVPTNGSVCDVASCSMGMPVLAPAAAGTSCGTMKTCNGTGSCTGCTVAADCPGTNTACQTVTCSAAGVCGYSYVASGTATPTQTAGDCQENVCNGMGAVVAVADDTDVPPAPSQCAVGTCSSGVPGSSPVAAGTACSSGGTECTGTGICGACIPGATRACCTTLSAACCEDTEVHTPRFHASPSTASPAGGGTPIEECCCDTTQECTSTGEWPTTTCATI
jgi:hypothetical protein